MPLGVEVGLGRGHIVLDGNPAPPKRGTAGQPPIFGQCLLWPNGWMDQDVTWNIGKPQHTPHCYMGVQLPPERGTASQFSAHVCYGQTIAHLSYC